MRTPPVVNVYIDGYNFYCFINKPETLRLGWCNFITLAHILAKKAFPRGYYLGAVKYYTARVREPLEFRTGEICRQRLWLDALQRSADFKVIVVEGYYKKDLQKRRVEKQTDTNIAIGIVRDALTPSTDDLPPALLERDRASGFDAAILVSADKDLRPAVDMAANDYGKDMVIFLPIEGDFSGAKDGRIRIYQLTHTDLENSRLPDVIERPGAEPILWRKYQELRNASTRYRPALQPVDADFDRRIFTECHQLSQRSPDLQTQVGCVVVGPDREFRSKGWNTFPEGIHNRAERLIAPAKYTWIEHAERNAIYRAGRIGRSLEDCTIYVELMPCIDCARAIIQSGIREVVVSAEHVDAYAGQHYREQSLLAQKVLEEAHVRIRRVPP